MVKKRNYTLLITGLVGLVLVRGFEFLFYDPLTPFFKNNLNWSEAFEATRNIKFYINAVLRFGLNLIFSALVVRGFFRMNQVRSFLKIGFVLGLPILALYHYAITNHEEGELILFYVRRIVIQPFYGIIGFMTLFYLEKTEGI